MNDEEKAFLESTVSRGQSLLHHLQTTHESPFDAVASCLLALGALAKGIELPLEDLLNGVKSAYDDIEAVDAKSIIQ